jgi:hypothetical protein
MEVRRASGSHGLGSLCRAPCFSHARVRDTQGGAVRHAYQTGIKPRWEEALEIVHVALFMVWVGGRDQVPVSLSERYRRYGGVQR